MAEMIKLKEKRVELHKKSSKQNVWSFFYNRSLGSILRKTLILSHESQLL
jgi:hypothetical protein